MKERLIGFIKAYFLFVFVFVLQKPLFMLFYRSLYPDVTWIDWWSVIWNGLPLDFSLAGYLTAIPGFLLIASVWTLSRFLHRFQCGYFLFISRASRDSTYLFKKVKKLFGSSVLYNIFHDKILTVSFFFLPQA